MQVDLLVIVDIYNDVIVNFNVIYIEILVMLEDCIVWLVLCVMQGYLVLVVDDDG